jgi:hypothetical protein
MTQCLAVHDSRGHALMMDLVSETKAAAIHTAYEQEGELAAALELRRRFSAITDNAMAADPCDQSPGGCRRQRGLPPVVAPVEGKRHLCRAELAAVR